MLKANENIANTPFYNLHNGNHNGRKNPHPQYVLNDNLNVSSENSNAKIDLNGLKIRTGYVDVETSSGTGAKDIANTYGFTNWCNCVGCTVELVDGSSTYIGLYYSNVWASKDSIRITADNPKSTAGGSVRVRFILIGE